MTLKKYRTAAMETFAVRKSFDFEMKCSKKEFGRPGRMRDACERTAAPDMGREDLVKENVGK